MYEVRENNTKNSINFLLVIVSFLPIICLTLYFHFESPLFLFPILFQVVALLNLLKSFFIKGLIPWIEIKPTLSQFDNDSFEVEFFATLKAAENDTYNRLAALSIIIKRALFLLVFSIFLTALACLFVFFNGSVSLYVAIVFLVIAFVCLYFHYKATPSSEFESKQEEFKKDIEKWLNE